MAFWEGYMSDQMMSTFGPIVVYWLYAGFYQVLIMLPAMDKYRLHTKKEENEKNLVPLGAVVQRVLLQQFFQAIIVFLVTTKIITPASETEVQPSILVQIVQCMIAMLVLDTWEYFMHRYLHENKFLYRHIHSHHHRFIVPYAIGTLYNHPIEGFLMDTIGGALSFLVSGMTVRTSIYFFSLATIKAIDDHCGLLLPCNIFHWFFKLDTAYHDTHHQLQGIRSNYSQPFFPLWDKVLGTYKPYQVVKRPEGGFEVRLIKQI